MLAKMIAVEVLEPEVLVDKGVIQQLLDAMNSSTESTRSTCLRFVLEARQISDCLRSKVVDFEMLPHVHLVEFSNNNACKDRSTSSQELEALKPGDAVERGTCHGESWHIAPVSVTPVPGIPRNIWRYSSVFRK
jgi:hypothetical protein